MDFYRVTYKNKGIYNELKRIVGMDTWRDLLIKEEFTWLPKPPSYADNNKSYFTENGFKMFKEKTLPIIGNYLNEKEIRIECLAKVSNIIYEDEYQVVVFE